MATVTPLPTANTEAMFWVRYQSLAQAAIDDPRLMLNRDHCGKLARAHAAWKDVFLEVCK